MYNLFQRKNNVLSKPLKVKLKSDLNITIIWKAWHILLGPLKMENLRYILIHNGCILLRSLFLKSWAFQHINWMSRYLFLHLTPTFNVQYILFSYFGSNYKILKQIFCMVKSKGSATWRGIWRKIHYSDSWMLYCSYMC